MIRIDTIDHYFQVQQATDVRWIPITPSTPGLYGLMQHPDGGFCRMPPDVVEAVTAEALRPTVAQLYRNTSGGRLRLTTNSQTIAVRANIGQAIAGARQAFLGTAGFDVYQRMDDQWIYAGCLAPEVVNAGVYEASFRFGSATERELLINFPLYSDLLSVELGLDEAAIMQPVLPTACKKVVFYGSSITQGGCAPRPGLSYPNILSRRLGFDFVNLGFSDGARVEPSMLDYLCSLDMDVLVYDYDHNAPELDFLRRTHLDAFRTIRERRPDLPILLASAPMANYDAVWAARREVILGTLQWALDQGDQLVGFVDGATMYPAHCKEECSEDGAHPNGLGMSCMADAFEPVLRKLLEK